MSSLGQFRYDGKLHLGAGTAGAPSLYFTDATTGLYRAGADSLGITTAGVQRCVIDSAGLQSGTMKFLGPGGSAGAPTYSFLSDSNSGMFSDNAGTVQISSDGTSRLLVSSTGVAVVGNISTSAGQVQANTYYNAAGDQLAMSTNVDTYLRLNNSGHFTSGVHVTGHLTYGSSALIGAQLGAANLNSVYVDQYAAMGFWQVSSTATNIPEAPDNANGVLSLHSHVGGYQKQLYFANTENLWMRRQSNGSWQTWHKLARHQAGTYIIADSSDSWTTSGWARNISLRSNSGALQFYNGTASHGIGNSGGTLYFWYTTSDSSTGDAANYHATVSSSGLWTLNSGLVLGNGYLYGNGSKEMARGASGDTWLRLNQSNHFTDGTYTPYAFRTDTGVYFGASAYINANSGTYGPLAVNSSKGSYGGMRDIYSGVQWMFDSSGNGGFYREASSLWYMYYLLSNSCLGLGGTTTSSSYELYVTGAIYATGDIVAFSDARKKENVVTIDNALDKVNKLRGVFFTRTDDETQRRQTGVIAQEVETVLPEVVTHTIVNEKDCEDRDEYGVNYGAIVGVLIEAVKELSADVNSLKAKLLAAEQR